MRRLCAQQLLALITTLTVFSYVMMPRPAAAAQAHIVNLSELENELSVAQQERAGNLADIERVLSLPAAQDALAKSRLSTDRVMTAVAELDSAELSRLADQARVAEKDVEGGLIVGLLALIGLVVVIVVVLSVIKSNE